MKEKSKHSPQNLLRESKFAALALNKYRNSFTFSKELWPKQGSCFRGREEAKELGDKLKTHDNIQIKTWIACLYFSRINLDCFLFVKCHEQHLHSKNS